MTPNKLLHISTILSFNNFIFFYKYNDQSIPKSASGAKKEFIKLKEERESENLILEHLFCRKY